MIMGGSGLEIGDSQGNVGSKFGRSANSRRQKQMFMSKHHSRQSGWFIIPNGVNQEAIAIGREMSKARSAEERMANGSENDEPRFRERRSRR
jgi:hypothetical protein